MYYHKFPFNKAYNVKIPTWNILGALTRDANAEDRVAEKIPAEINGANPDTMLITLRKGQRWKSKSYKPLKNKKSQYYTSLLCWWRRLIPGKYDNEQE